LGERGKSKRGIQGGIIVLLLHGFVCVCISEQESASSERPGLCCVSTIVPRTLLLPMKMKTKKLQTHVGACLWSVIPHPPGLRSVTPASEERPVQKSLADSHLHSFLRQLDARVHSTLASPFGASRRRWSSIGVGIGCADLGHRSGTVGNATRLRVGILLGNGGP